jgi:hypothetical protein
MTIEAQKVILPEILQPFQINTVIVKDLPDYGSTDVMIYGLTAEGYRIPLFSSRRIRSTAELHCYVYVDDSIQTAEIEVDSSDRSPVSFEFPIRQNPYRIAVLGSRYPPVIRGSSFDVASSIEHLDPGDIYIFQESDPSQPSLVEVRRLLSKGVHVLGTRILAAALGSTDSSRPDPWYGRLLTNDSVDAAASGIFLESRRKVLLLYKKRYFDLIAKASFFGIRSDQQRPLSFREAKPEDIAFTMERELFRSRLNLSHKLMVIAFYLPVLMLVAIIKKGKILLLVISALLLLFSLVSLFNPSPDRLLSIWLNPSHTEGKTVELIRIPSPETAARPRFSLLSRFPEEYRFFAQDFSAEHLRLKYTMIHSSGRRTTLEHFRSAKALKLNQIPHICLVRGTYFIEHANPLRAWSLYEPE